MHRGRKVQASDLYIQATLQFIARFCSIHYRFKPYRHHYTYIHIYIHIHYNIYTTTMYVPSSSVTHFIHYDPFSLPDISNLTFTSRSTSVDYMLKKFPFLTQKKEEEEDIHEKIPWRKFSLICFSISHIRSAMTYGRKYIYVLFLLILCFVTKLFLCDLSSGH